MAKQRQIELDQREGEIKSLRNQIQLKDQELSRAESNLKQATTEGHSATQMTSQLDASVRKIQFLENELTTVQDKLAETSKQLSESTLLCDRVQRSLECSEKKNQDLENKIQESKVQLQAKTEELEQIKKEISSL